MRPAGYQRPVEHPHKLDTGDKMWPESRVIVTGWVSEQSSKLVRWDLRNASSVCRVNLLNSENETVSRSCVIIYFFLTVCCCSCPIGRDGLLGMQGSGFPPTHLTHLYKQLAQSDVDLYIAPVFDNEPCCEPRRARGQILQPHNGGSILGWG